MSNLHHSLEQFVATGLAALPKITTEASAKIAYQTCSTYHTKCSSILRQVLSHVGQYSPKHCKLISDIWDVASINVLMLLKVAQISLQERAQLCEDNAYTNQFRQECEFEQAGQLKVLLADVDALKQELRQVKAELQTTQRKLSRSKFEKERLEKILDQMTKERNDEEDEEDEDGIQHDEEEENSLHMLMQNVDKYQQISSLENEAEDLDRLFNAIELENKNQLNTLGQLDRYIDSSMVSILWKHQPKQSNNSFVEKMFTVESKATQTDEQAKLNEADSNANGLDDESSQTPRTRKKLLVIPACIRTLLDCVPRVPKMLLKKSLIHIIWVLLLRKLDSEFLKPNTTMPTFMRDYFLQKFGLKSLADFHLVEQVKSCIFYRRKLENATLLLEQDPSGGNLDWDDSRILLFGRCVDIFADEPLCPHLQSDGLPMLLDYLGDVLEIDPAINTLQAVQEMDGPITVNREIALIVYRCHFNYMGPDLVEKAVYEITEHELEHPKEIDLDWLLAFVLYRWSTYEQSQEQTVRTAFRTVLLQSSGQHTTNLLLQMDGFTAAVVICWPECVEATVQDIYMNMMAEKREGFRLASERRRRERQHGNISTGHLPATTVLGIDGVFEEEFVAVMTKLLRTQRPKWGIRTRGHPLWSAVKETWFGGMGRRVSAGPVPPSSLKPGIKQ
ncbi:hypothetical protein THRCLA_00744 [Thraustotheca clavata]|uniref:Uncharacterized protein n=1 Tax=Thraustotheca clavata TaxID=74557 RepID=A0A1W0AAC9_9STRA|nr:hypothetical protein THRCLA_00744 [Thraustotheca clavata]